MNHDLLNFFGHFDAFCTEDPNRRVDLGIMRDLGELPDPTMEGILFHGNRQAGKLIEKARQLRDHLTGRARPNELLDLDLATLWLEQRREETLRTLTDRDGSPHEQTTKLTTTEDLGSPLLRLMIADPRRVEDRLEDLHRRISSIKTYLFRTRVSRLHAPLVARWVESERAGISGLPTLLDSIENMAAVAGWHGHSDLELSIIQAKEALAEYDTWLATRTTTTRFDIGEAQTKEVVRTRGITLSLDELHAMARDFLAENRRQIEDLRQKLARKYGLSNDVTASDMLTHLNERFRLAQSDESFAGARATVLAAFEGETPRLLRFILARGLFPIPDHQEMRVMRTPGFLEGTVPSGAMSPCAPFAPGASVSLVMQTLTEDRLGDHTALSVPLLMLHEGIPGHHLQCTWAARHPSSVRKLTSWNDLSEGWTTYLEEFMLDAGYGEELEDELRFLTLWNSARLGARVAIDLFFMTGEPDYLNVGVPCDLTSQDPFVAAGSLLIATTGFSEARAQSELDWYSRERGYPLSYLVGNRLMLALKEAFLGTAPNGTIRNDRTFHDAVLHAGNLPMSFLRRHFADSGLL